MSKINDNLDYAKQNRKLILFSICLITVIVITSISYAFLFGSICVWEMSYILFFGGFACVFTVINYLIENYCMKSKKKPHHSFTFKLDKITNLETLTKKLKEDKDLKASFEEENQGIYLVEHDAFWSYRRTRYAIIHMESYNKDEFKSRLKSLNKKYNRRHPDPKRVPNAIGRYRVNIVIIDNWNKELELKINDYANHGYRRVECISFYVIYQNKLYVQPYYLDTASSAYRDNNKFTYNYLKNL